MKTSYSYVCIVLTGVLIGVLTGYLLATLEKDTEAFTDRGVPAIRCGVDLPTCAVGTQCINGFCRNPSVPSLPPNQLPVFP